MSWLPPGPSGRTAVSLSPFRPRLLRDLFQANILALLLKDRVISTERVERDFDYLEWIARLTSQITDYPWK